MYICKDQLRKIKLALQYFPKGEDWNKLQPADRVVITNALIVLSDIEKKRVSQKQKVNERIKEKRKENWKYGRYKKEIAKRYQAQENRAIKSTSTQLNNTCYHCNYFRLIDSKGSGHCLHRETSCGMIYYLNEACEHYEKEVVKYVCTKQCKDCKYLQDLDVCGSKICKHIDNRSFLIQGTYEACASFQPR